MCITSTKLASKEFNRELKAWNKGPAGSKAVKETLFVFKALNFAPYRKEKFAKKKNAQHRKDIIIHCIIIPITLILISLSSFYCLIIGLLSRNLQNKKIAAVYIYIYI